MVARIGTGEEYAEAPPAHRAGERRYAPRVRAVVAIGLALACLSGSAGASDGTSLRIRYWAEGKTGSSTLWTLRCAPSGGTHPRAAAACDVLAKVQTPFAPVPKDVACTQVYGGPQVARVSGTLRGRRVWAVFQRRDGCEIARWARAGALLPTPPRGPT
jgi:Subtilisin inhibitor-like